MRSWLVIVAAVTAWSGTLARQPASTVTVVMGARVLDAATGRTQSTAAIVIENGRVSAIRSEPGSLPPAAATVDASGLILVPGLGDLFVDASPSAWLDADYYYSLGLAFGVTSYRLVDTPLEWSADQRRRAAVLDLLAPRLWITGPGLDVRILTDEVTDNAVIRLDGRVRVATGEDLARRVVTYADRASDWIHLGPNVGPEAARLAVAAARRHKLKVSAEAGEASPLELARAGVDAVVGLGPADGTVATGEARPLARELSGKRAVLVPMLRRTADGALSVSHPVIARELEALPRRFRDDVRARLGTPRSRNAEQAWRSRQQFVRAFVSAGGRVAVGSGTGALGWPVPGLAVLHELELLVDSGVSTGDALRAATLHAAATLGADHAGRIRAGAPADFAGVEGDPSKDIRALARVRLVVRGGEILDRDDLIGRASRAASRIR